MLLMTCLAKRESSSVPSLKSHRADCWPELALRFRSRKCLFGGRTMLYNLQARSELGAKRGTGIQW